MREIAVDAIKAGMRLAQPVYSPDDKICLGQGTVLTDSWIEKIKGWGRKSVRVTNDRLERDELELEALLQQAQEVLEPPVAQTGDKRAALKKEEDVFKAAYEHAEGQLRRIYLWTRCSNKAPVEELEQLAQTAVYPLLNMGGAFRYLHGPSRSENYLYRHALDVALLSGLLGRWLGYNEVNVKDLVSAGLLHDIGKARVYFEILSKPGGLTPEELELAKIHVTHSRQLLTTDYTISDTVFEGIFQHHERLDGSGYPLGLYEHQINAFGRVLAVADVYDALISDRYYKKGVTPFTAIEIMMHHMSGKFDAHILGTFIEGMRQQFIGAAVILSNGSAGKIMQFPSIAELRPLIRLVDGTVLDLTVKNDIEIESLKVL